MTKKEVKDLIFIASELVGVDISKNTKVRKHEYAFGRQLVIYVLITNNRCGYEVAGNIFGKHHTSAIHAKQTIQNRIDTEPKFKSEYSKILDYYKKTVLKTEVKYKHLRISRSKQIINR